MKAFLAILALLVVVLLGVRLYSTPSATTEMTEAEIAQIEAEVMEWGEAWGDAWEPSDRCDILLPLFHPDHVIRFTGGEPKRRDGWFEYCEGNMANWVSFRGTWSDKNVRVISPDAVVLIIRYDGTWEYANGEIRRYPTGAHQILLERTATGWGAVIFQNYNGPRAEG